MKLSTQTLILGFVFKILPDLFWRKREIPLSMILAHSFSFRKELGKRLKVESKSVLIYQNGYLGDGAQSLKGLSSIKASLVLFT